MSNKKTEINYLENWHTLNSYIQHLDEEKIVELLEQEKKSGQRPAFLLRLYGRFNKLRTTRERQQLLTNIVEL